MRLNFQLHAKESRCQQSQFTPTYLQRSASLQISWLRWLKKRTFAVRLTTLPLPIKHVKTGAVQLVSFLSQFVNFLKRKFKKCHQKTNIFWCFECRMKFCLSPVELDLPCSSFLLPIATFPISPLLSVFKASGGCCV